MELLEYNTLQLQAMIDKYKHLPSNEELTVWIQEYAKQFKDICDSGICDIEEIEKILYKKPE